MSLCFFFLPFVLSAFLFYSSFFSAAVSSLSRCLFLHLVHVGLFLPSSGLSVTCLSPPTAIRALLCALSLSPSPSLVVAAVISLVRMIEPEKLLV